MFAPQSTVLDRFKPSKYLGKHNLVGWGKRKSGTFMEYLKYGKFQLA